MIVMQPMFFNAFFQAIVFSVLPTFGKKLDFLPNVGKLSL